MPWRKTFLLGFGFFGVSLLWPLYDSYVPVFLRAFGLSNVLVGFLMTLDNWANLFIQPTVGALSDRTRTRWGRRYPFILLGAPIAAIGGILIPIAAAQTLLLLVGAMLLMNMSMALFRSPTVALLGDVFPSELRSKANGVINFMGLLAAVLSFLVGGMLYKINPVYPFIAAAVLMISVLALLVTLVPEPVESHLVEREDDEAQGLRGVVQTLRSAVENRTALLVLSALLAWSIGFTAIQAFFTLYARAELSLHEGTASQMLSLYPLAGLVFAIPGGYLGTYLGRRRTLLFCLAILGLLLLGFQFVGTPALDAGDAFTLMNPVTWFVDPTIRILILMLMAAGAAMTIITVNVLPMLFDAAPGSRAGSYTGLYYLFGSIASICGPPLAGLVVDLTGSYRTIFIFAPLFVLLGWVLIWMVRGGEPKAAVASARAAVS